MPSEADVQRWKTFPKAFDSNGIMGWFGKQNMTHWEPGTYSPAPPQEVMNCIEKVWNQSNKSFDWHSFPVANYMNWVSYYSVLLGWIMHTDIGLPFIGFTEKIQSLATGPVPPDLETRAVLTHFTGWIFAIVEPICKLNQQQKAPLFHAFPTNWSLQAHQVEGHHVDILKIAQQIPPLNDFPCPPPNICGIIINYTKEVSKAFGEKRDNTFLPPPKDDPNKANQVLSAGNRSTMTSYFQKTFPTLADQAIHIATSEVLPYYQWQGAFMNVLVDRVQKQTTTAHLYEVEFWRKNWPPRNPMSVWIELDFKGTSEIFYPPAYWPMPKEDLVKWLEKVAVLPGANTKSGGKMRIAISDAQFIKSCFHPDGWFNLPEAQSIDVSNLESQSTKNALLKALPMVFAYAVALRSLRNQRKGDWKWDLNGDLSNPTPYDRYKTCLVRKNIRLQNGGNKYLTNDVDNSQCEVSQIKGWEHPWELSEPDLRLYLNAIAGQPAIRPIRAGENEPTGEYTTKANKSVGDYRKWYQTIINNPLILKTYPVGCSVGTLPNTHPPVDVLNLYPNYGLWIVGEKDDDWIHFLLNPYTDLFGKSAFSAIMGAGEDWLNFEIKMFNKIVKTTLDTVDKATDTVVKDVPKIAGAAADSLSVLAGPALIYAGAAAGLMIVYSQTMK